MEVTQDLLKLLSKRKTTSDQADINLKKIKRVATLRDHFLKLHITIDP